MTAPTVITCPDRTAVPGPSIFLAGGISGCPDWQTEAAQRLSSGVTVFNPRRDNFPITDPAAAPEQVDWEYDHLLMADVVLFWFPESVVAQPIALLEFGVWALRSTKPVAVGADPRYPRAFDVRHQASLYQPDLTVWPTLAATCAEATRLLELAR